MGRLCLAAVVKGLGRGVVVLGMHRSGTSAVTGVIDALGLPACRPADRMPYDLFESTSLGNFDEALLKRLGGYWFAPPPLPRGWTRRADLVGDEALAAQLFREAHPFDQWVWKDPRACVLMPFWDLVLGADIPRVIMLRNPLESAASLYARNRMPKELALALAERSLRSAFRNSAKRPVLVTVYDNLFTDLDGWCSRFESFIRPLGLSLPAPLRVEAARAMANPGLRHHREAGLGPEAGAGLRRLWTWALGKQGAHESFSITGLPRESPGTAGVLRTALTNFHEWAVRPPG